jgi:SAM-dependent methyltransferase
MAPSSIAQSWYRDLMVCPDCRDKLLNSEDGLSCKACGYVSAGRDLRPRNPKYQSISFARLQEWAPSEVLSRITTHGPAITYEGPSAIRDSRQFMSIISSKIRSPARILDLGCGPGDQRVPIEYLGYQYVGVDFSAEKAELLADAHALPFADGAFDCVLSYAVLQHLHNPNVAIREIERVLAKGGIYVGTVSQGEPFIESYFHHTAWGFISLLASTDTMKPMQLWAATDTLRSLSRMGRYSRLFRFLFSVMDTVNRKLPFLTPRKMRWSVKDKEVDAIHRAGSIAFLVVKS